MERKRTGKGRRMTTEVKGSKRTLNLYDSRRTLEVLAAPEKSNGILGISKLWLPKEGIGTKSILLHP